MKLPAPPSSYYLFSVNCFIQFRYVDDHLTYYFSFKDIKISSLTVTTLDTAVSICTHVLLMLTTSQRMWHILFLGDYCYIVLQKPKFGLLQCLEDPNYHQSFLSFIHMIETFCLIVVIPISLGEDENSIELTDNL